MANKSENKVTASLIYLTRTAASLLVKEPSSKVEIFLPLSKIEFDEDDLIPGERLDVILPGWLAEREGLV